MMDNAGSRKDGLKCLASRMFRLSVSPWAPAVAIGALLAAGEAGWQSACQAIAAPVDAIGAPAPVGFADIIEKIKPAVVGVRVRVEQSARSDSGQELPLSPGSPLDRFFRQFGIPTPDSPTPKSETALGSGFFISGDGYIVTNNHLVANGKSLLVTTDDGKVYPAEVVGTDQPTDVALIKIAAHADFPYVRFAAAEPRIGDWVLPVGNPFGLGGTVTAGIVSARGRDIGAGPYDDFIQIDAPVNKGNSGGPTFNVRGEVVGVNTAIYSPSGGSVGVAFDIPAATVNFVVQQLREKGHVTRGWIGVQIQPVTSAMAEAVGLKQTEGALVAATQPGSPAAKSGIEAGDVIVSVNGETVKDARGLARKIAAIAPGTPAKMGIFRNGRERTIAVVLGELPPTNARAEREQKTPSERSALGFSLAPASAVAGAGDHGVVVTDVSPNSPAAESGLQTGDVILEIGRGTVNTPADVSKMVNEARAQAKRAILLRVKRGEGTIFVAVPLA